MLILIAALLAALLSGCISQQPVWATAPTPSPSPSPTPMPLSQSITPEPRPTDARGSVVYTEDHYLQYLSFEEIRVYEYGGGTYLDGVCNSTYPKTLFGQMGMAFFDEDGTEVANTELHSAQSFGLVIYPGKNHIYAQIGTDMDVQMMDYTFTVITTFMPE
ncbi:MAG: hypothetical protein PHO41_05675 [Eubacteriales bacterium]|nr:hypothetical protein [Eubacteriales bacterium]